jgi:hypothetical protein
MCRFWCHFRLECRLMGLNYFARSTCYCSLKCLSLLRSIRLFYLFHSLWYFLWDNQAQKWSLLRRLWKLLFCGFNLFLMLLGARLFLIDGNLFSISIEKTSIADFTRVNDFLFCELRLRLRHRILLILITLTLSLALLMADL